MLTILLKLGTLRARLRAKGSGQSNTLLRLHNPVARRVRPGRTLVASPNQVLTHAARAAASCTPRAPSRDFKSLRFASNEGLTTSDKAARHLWWPRAARAKGSG